jgi:hypothetical protein
VTTVADVDRLVQKDDAVAARIWPRLGPKVREAYLHDRDAWIAVRREVDAGKEPSAEALAASHKAFGGWARAFHAASRPRKRAHVAQPPSRAAAAPPSAAPASVAAPPPLATVQRASAGSGVAVAGGLALAGLIAFAARRKRA